MSKVRKRSDNLLSFGNCLQVASPRRLFLGIDLPSVNCCQLVELPRENISTVSDCRSALKSKLKQREASRIDVQVRFGPRKRSNKSNLSKHKNLTDEIQLLIIARSNTDRNYDLQKSWFGDQPRGQLWRTSLSRSTS